MEAGIPERRRGRTPGASPRRIFRAATSGLLGLLLVAGCTSQVRVPREKMTPGSTLGKSRVFLHDGSFYEFDRCSFLPDSLVGEYRMTVERSTPEEGTYYSDEARTFHLALGAIDSVRVIRRDLGKTLLVGAGGAAVVGLIVNLADRGTSSPNGPTDESKPPPE